MANVVEPDTWNWPYAYHSQRPPFVGWMAGLCLERDMAFARSQTAWQAYVQRIAIQGQDWSVATNGKGLLAIMDHGQENWNNGHTYPETFAKVGGHTEKHLRDFIVCDTVEPFECDLNDLLAFVGEFKLEPCKSCNGSGCEDCDYDGELWPDPLDGVRLRWDGRWFDRTLLAKYLTPLKWYCCRIKCGFQKTRVTGKDSQALIVDAKGFNEEKIRVVVMGMSRNRMIGQGFVSRSHANSPRYIPGIGALWHHYGTAFEHPLRDWIQDQGEDPDEVLGVPF